MEEERIYDLDNYEREVILNNLSDNILIGTIENQFKSILPPVNTDNIISIFDERYAYLYKMHEDNADILEYCKACKNNFYSKVLGFICKKFGII